MVPLGHIIWIQKSFEFEKKRNFFFVDNPVYVEHLISLAKTWLFYQLKGFQNWARFFLVSKQIPVNFGLRIGCFYCLNKAPSWCCFIQGFPEHLKILGGFSTATTNQFHAMPTTSSIKKIIRKITNQTSEKHYHC